jgi:polyphosphate kinase
MDRNFFRRVEISFPVLDAKLKKRVISEGLKPYLDDNSQAWEMDQDGQYQLCSPRRGKPVVAQETLLESLARAQLPS